MQQQHDTVHLVGVPKMCLAILRDIPARAFVFPHARAHTSPEWKTVDVVLQLLDSHDEETLYPHAEWAHTTWLHDFRKQWTRLHNNPRAQVEDYVQCLVHTTDTPTALV